MPDRTTARPTPTLIALDLETTGLFPVADRVVEIGAVRFDPSGRELGRFQRLVNPCRPMPRSAFLVHGLSDADLAGAPTAAEVLPEFLAWLGEPGEATLLAHNAGFDAAFLGRELAASGRPMPGHEIVDTLALARSRLPSAPNHQLGTLTALLGLDADDSHRALSDSLRVKGLWLALTRDGPPPSPVAYRIAAPSAFEVLPAGWERLADAITRRRRVRMEYDGGTRGVAPREITPRRFARQGGIAYVVAFCHIDRFEKSFRLDRVRRYEVLDIIG